jgi:HEAT repeat protein
LRVDIPAVACASSVLSRQESYNERNMAPMSKQTNEDHGDADRLKHVQELGRRGRELIEQAKRDGQAALDADRRQQQSGR